MSNFWFTKLRRRIIKRYIKITHEKSNWFKADYWPDIKNHNHEWYFRDTRLEVLPLSSIDLTNKSVNIIGSGPSVKNLELDKLKDSNNIFLNGAISLSYDYDLPVFAHVIMDSNFVYNCFDLIKRKVQYRTKLILSLGALCAIAERDLSILQRNDIYIFHIKPLSDECHFSIDIDNYLIDGGTVMAIAIQAVLQSHPKKVYLLGLDISNAHLPRFYESQGNMQKSGLQKDFEHKILPFMTAASSQYKNDNVEIFNCSPISKLPFEIISYSDYYAK
jgi:hypothetical protein